MIATKKLLISLLMSLPGPDITHDTDLGPSQSRSKNGKAKKSHKSKSKPSEVDHVKEYASEVFKYRTSSD